MRDHEDTSVSVFSRGTMGWFLLCAILSLLVVGIRGREARHAATSLQSQFDSVSRVARRASVERAGLLQVIGEMPIDHPFLSGIDARTGEVVDIEVAGDGLYWFMSSTCAVCRVGIERLQTGALQAGVPLIILSRFDNQNQLLALLGDTSRFAHEALGSVSGGLALRAPRHGVPMLVAVRGGRINGMWTGLPSPAEWLEAHDSVRGRASSR